MRVVFSVGKPDSFRRVFRFNIDYIDTIITEKYVVFCFDNRDLFGAVQLPVDMSSDFEEKIYACRIPKNILLQTFSNVSITLSMLDSYIFMQIQGKKHSFSVKCDIQNVNYDVIEEKLGILSIIDSYKSIDLNIFRMPMKLCSEGNSINVSSDYLYFELKNVMIFSKVNTPNFSIFPQLFNYLLGIGDKAHLVQQYLAVSKDNMLALANMSGSIRDSDIKFILKKKTLNKIHVDLTNAILVLKTLRNYENISLNLSTGELLINIQQGVVATVNIEVESVVDNMDFSQLIESKNNPFEIPKLVLPSVLVSEIIVSLNIKEIYVLVKKNFLQINLTEGILAVCRRMEAS